MFYRQTILEISSELFHVHLDLGIRHLEEVCRQAKLGAVLLRMFHEKDL